MIVEIVIANNHVFDHWCFEPYDLMRSYLAIIMVDVPKWSITEVAIALSRVNLSRKLTLSNR